VVQSGRTGADYSNRHSIATQPPAHQADPLTQQDTAVQDALFSTL
jgi:hypothetical protein